MNRLPRLLVALSLAVAMTPGASAQSDADFLSAKNAFNRGDARRLEALSVTLRGHVLEPYVRAWQLRLGLDSTDPESIRAFLVAQTGTPYANELRADWLKSLATRGQWTLFQSELRAYTGEDAEIACHAIALRSQRDGAAALADAKPLWMSARATPDACEPLFAALFASGALRPEDRRARFRLATEAGQVRFAQTLAASQPPGERIAERDLARVEGDPLAAVARGEFAFKQAAGRDLALYALERAARKDPALARVGWLKWRAQLPPSDRAYGNGRLGFYAARAHVGDAHLLFRETKETVLSEEQHAWRVRAALRALAWADVVEAVEAMPAALADDAPWRYWKARSLAALGRAEEATPLFERLAGEYHFYAHLAAESLKRTVVGKSEPASPTPEALAAFGARPAVRRAVKLAELELRAELVREWILIVRGLDDEALLIAAEYSRRAGLYDRAINTAERTAVRHDFGLRYLMPYRDAFDAAARAHDVELSLLFAIARQESRFVPGIVSSAGAQGLMQLMPATARWVAKQLNETGYRPDRVTDVELNTRFGAFYIGHLLERLEGHPALATAAYNAGPGRAQAWRPQAPLEGAIWVETIPFNETRDYVKKVLSNATFYARALGRQPTPLSAVLGTIGPRAAAAVPAAATPATAGARPSSPAHAIAASTPN